MKSVPSLVASSTVGVAAVGLAFAKPERTTPSRPSSNKRKLAELADLNSSTPNSRPATSATVITPESRTSRRPTSSSPNAPIIHQQPNVPSMSRTRRLSVVKSAEAGGHDYIGEEIHRRDSMSSRGSWMRRLSTFPSTHSSPRSSVGPDSPSINLSHGSAAPILSNPNHTPTQLPPNKLVKRATSDRSASDGPVLRTRSRGQLPTLRRPATSHQRSVTLQQQFREDSAARERSFETPTKQPTPLRRFHTSNSPQPWRQYFEARTTKLTKERSSAFSGEGAVQNSHATARRIVPDESARPTLVQAHMITSAQDSEVLYFDESFTFEEDNVEDEHTHDTMIPSPEGVDQPKRPRRSLSMHFSSPSSWVTRTGSLRGKRNDPAGGGKRYSSAPGPMIPARSTTSHGARNRGVLDPAVFHNRPTHTSAERNPPSDPFDTTFQARIRNTSSPLPPLSRLSSFNLDLARLGQSATSSSAPPQSPTSPLPQTTTAATSFTSTLVSPNLSSYYVVHSKTPRTSEVADRASTLVGSDNETKGFTSGDEDDMDFQSETVFDSLRSGATNSVRSHHTPLDTMFDDSSPSVNGHSKNKRQSIHEMLVSGGYQEDDARIMEEDEGMPTPVKTSRASARDHMETPVRLDARDSNAYPTSPPSFSLSTRDFSRLSLEDEEEDEDWTRDDENLDVGNLSPPSSMNSRRVSPSIREALADVTHNGSANGNSTPADRPKSNLFDWAEPSSAEKVDHLGNSPRPKTAHVKQHADSRGGRALGRRGPSALHVRSQSVPVVPDLAGQREHSKLTPKFGTWGLGAKGVSEDWDNDFEFDSLDNNDSDEGYGKLEKSGMLVPPAIQASQANVVGHVGQIREVCLLVEDLKRLRLLAKEKELLEGKYAALWKEAEGIIALAVPDEEDPTLSAPQSPSSIHEKEDEEKYYDQGYEADDLQKPEAPFEVLNRHGRPTGFIYDGGTVRRRSVFSPGDDIFGAGTLNSPPSREHLRPPSTSTRNSMRSTSDVARSVMETMHQHRSTSDPLLKNLTYETSSKMPFDTTSLRDLVHRANVLTRTLSDLINKSDAGFDSPEVSPQRESSPAFTRVFTDPMQNPPKHLPRSQSNNSVLGGSIDSSPTRSLGQRMHMMTVV